MKTAQEIFEEYIEKVAREWWGELPRHQTYPYTSWEVIPDDAKWSIYGMYVDHLRGVGFAVSCGSLGKVIEK